MAKGKKKAKVSKAKKNLLRKGSSKTKTKKPVSKKSKPVKVAKKQKLVVAQPVKEVKNEKEITSEFKIKVENVVSFASLGVEFPLERLVEEVENTEYEPEQFPGLVYRITDPRAAALIFSSGKIVCTGAKSIENSKIAMHKVVERIGKLKIRVPKTFDIIVENIVSSSKINAKINLEEIAFMLENAEYEPEQFPGLVYRITEPRVAFLLFSSGKIICTGAHSLNDIKRALEKFKERLEEIGIKVEPAQD